MINPEYYKEGSKKYGPSKFIGTETLLYEYVRGSEAYGLATETSDIDRGGIYLCPNDDLLGILLRGTPATYCQQISSEKHDDIWYELGRFGELLLECNPNIIESLFVDDEFVIYEHPVITELKKNRDMFITQSCFPKFGGYAISQIQKARGLNKKIVKPVLSKKSPLEFVYTFHNQGSTQITYWLKQHGLFQEFCGLVKVPNMHNTYGLYYDWYAHIEAEEGLRNVLERMYTYWSQQGLYDFTPQEAERVRKFEKQFQNIFKYELDIYVLRSLLKREPAGYRGIVKENSQDLCLSSVPSKFELPLTYIVYNQEGYAQHARDYTSYQKWEKERNPERFALNEGYAFDSKNMCHAVRLVKMCIEIANGEGVHVHRDSDREYLLNIKNHKYSYEEIMQDLDKLKEEMDQACKNSNIPKKADFEFINNFVLNIRKNNSI